MRYWLSIEYAAKDPSIVIIGIVLKDGKRVSGPFPSWWSAYYEEFTGMPTHHIDMPEFEEEC